MKNIRIIFAAVLGMMLAACSNDDIVQNSATNGAGGGKPMPFSATITTPAGTRGLTEATDGKSITAKWVVGEEIALIHGKTVDVMKVKSVDDKGVATIEGTITNATEGEAVHVVYVGTNGMENFKTKLNTALEEKAADDPITKAYIDKAVGIMYAGDPQSGTLAAINDGLDYRYASSTLTCPGSVYTFGSAVTPESQLAVWKLSLSGTSSTTDKPLLASQLWVYDGDKPLAWIKPEAATNEMYAVVPAVSSKDLTITATVGSDTYTATKSAVTLSAGYYYHSALKMQKVVDLAKLTSAYEAQDGNILTGTLGTKVMISIAAGATVTLKDANINMNDDGGAKWTDGSYAGITCIGNATIILEGTNKVQGFANKYAGIQAAYNGSETEYTLTITGDGSLEAIGGSGGAGIGSGESVDCGNIVINGGTIIAQGGSGDLNGGAGIGSGFLSKCGNITIKGGTITKAQGGKHAAGIGYGNSSKCGDITISGGTVMAHGGEFGAGIGSGLIGECGNITITTSVTKVTAINGDFARKSIGAGSSYYDKHCTCGTIKFGDQTVYDGASWTIDLVNGNYGGLSLTVSTTTNDNDTWTLTPVSSN